MALSPLDEPRSGLQGYVAFPKSEEHPKITTPMNLQAPEVLLGTSITEKIDIWSIGCMAYEILTG